MDYANGLFEIFGALFVLLNVRRIVIDKRVAGVSIIPTAFFALWGFWNLVYYPHLDQWASFVGAIGVAICNTSWVVLALYYRRAK